MSWTQKEFIRYFGLTNADRFRLPPGMKLNISKIDAYNDVIALSLETFDSYRPGTPTTIVSNTTVYGHLRGDFDQIVVAEARSLWLHEFDEWMMIDGKLVNDPHARS